METKILNFSDQHSFSYLRVFPVLLLFFSFTAQPQTLSESISTLLKTNACMQCDLQGADLSNRDLTDANLEAANLTGANLTNTNLRGANLSFSILKGVIFSDTKLAGSNLRNADLSDLDIDVAFEWMEIIGTQLEGARFKEGVTCGPFPEKGGWGCQHVSP